jgi:hypothetical protein
MVGETVKGSTLVQMESVPILLYDQVGNGKETFGRKASTYLISVSRAVLLVTLTHVERSSSAEL